MKKEIAKAYEAKKYEDSLYKKWEESGVFSPKIEKGKKPFTIMMPPPNATGQLHLGHAMMLAVEDIMIRYHRMKGDPSLWIPGTDHAAIATQNKVEQELAKKGITRHDLGREKFLQEVRKYVKNSQGTIRQQIRKMGSSCDWTRERYTLDEGLSKVVEKVFVKMYKDDLIYRGDRIVNWCPRCHSTLSDDEVDYKEVNTKLYWIKYGPFILATTRPETKLGDTAVAVHPKDKRYKDMIGKKYMIPGVLGEFEVIVVGDEAVDPEFGSGVVKVTPAHSFADFEIAQRHNIKAKKVINEDGKMMENCGKYEGMTTAECRQEILKDMEKMGLLEKVEDYNHKLSICYRCGTSIEPLTSKQWFVDVNKKVKSLKNRSLKEISLDVVKDGSIKIIPSRFNKTYFHWMENLRDWCISRQIWWGHRIPVWYCKECGEVHVSGDKPTKCSQCSHKEFKQDPDTLDTWFSAGLWTFSTLDWPDGEDFKYFHPTSVLETGYDILFFWVARMILMTTYVTGDVPFKNVYLHGLIRDKNGEKMSKSKPETCIDPLDMIEKYGTDSVRLSLVIGGTPGNDMRIYEEKIAGYRNFINKIWNSSRFVLMNLEEEDLEVEFNPKMVKSLTDKWIVSRLNEVIKESTKDIENHRFSDAGMKIYDFFWSEFCNWYLEISKGEFQNKAVLKYVLENLLKLLHPFTPFVTEVIWGELRKEKMLIEESWPKPDPKLSFAKEEKLMQRVLDIVSAIRKARAEYNVPPGKMIATVIYSKYSKDLESQREPIMRLARLEELEIKEKGKKPAKSKAVILPHVEIYIPLEEMVDVDKEKGRLEKEIESLKQYLEKIDSKLNNKGFLNNASQELIDQEKIKREEVENNLQKVEKEFKEL